MEELPEDYYVKRFAFTKMLHQDIYPAIDLEKNQALSQHEKVVVSTGASGGIGQKVCLLQ